MGRLPKVSFNFFHLKKYYTLNISIYLKVVLTNLFWVINFGQGGCRHKKIQKHPPGCIFLKSY